MVVFYRGPCSRITQEVFETWCPTYRRYVLRDLRELGVVEQAVDPPPVAGLMRNASTGVAGATAVAVALGWAEGWQVFESPAVAMALLALLIASAIVSGACWRARPVRRELVGVYHGEPVALFWSTDTRVFDEVKRSLTRAVERLDDAR